MGLASCPACGSVAFQLAKDTGVVRAEIQLRTSFVFERIGRRATRSELKDLVDFMHGSPAPLARCSNCGMLVRGEQDVREARSYEEDANDLDLMAHVYPHYLDAFRRKSEVYRPLLKPNSDILEIGSHLGAFLQTAAEWDWNAAALDVGNDTAQFARSRGFRVERNVIEEASFPPAAFDAVFIWNCFEQIPEPGATLKAVHRALKRNGLLVVRVPNPSFYSVLSRRLRKGKQGSFVVQALGYNNLLGFPYLYGYSAEALTRLMSNYDFAPVMGANSELVTMPFADITRQIADEQKIVSETVAQWSTVAARSGELTGPWLEMVFRKLDGLESKLESSVQRLSRRKINARFLKRAA